MSVNIYRAYMLSAHLKPTSEQFHSRATEGTRILKANSKFKSKKVEFKNSIKKKIRERLIA